MSFWLIRQEYEWDRAQKANQNRLDGMVECKCERGAVEAEDGYRLVTCPVCNGEEWTKGQSTTKG